MSHEEPLAQCQVNWELVKEHLKDSGHVRSKVDISAQQLLTLEQARLATMDDIKAIKADVADINKDLSTIKNVVERVGSDVKIWVLSGVLGTIVCFAVPMVSLIGSSGEVKQQIFRLEKLHPYGSGISTQGTVIGGGQAQ